MDDDKEEHYIVRRLLAGIGVPREPKVMENARCAVQALQLSGRNELPNLILCDLKMPEMDGFDFLRWLRQSEFKCIPVVICSNSDQPVDVTRAYALGARAYHMKPATIEAYQKCLSSAVRYWAEACQLPSFV